MLMINIDDKNRMGQPVQLSYTSQYSFDFIAFTSQSQSLLLRHIVHSSIMKHPVDIIHFFHRSPHGGKVGHHTSRPSIGHIMHVHFECSIGNNSSCLSFGRYEKDFLSGSRQSSHFVSCLLKGFRCTVEIDDMNPFVLGKNVGLHAWIPLPS